MRNGEFLARATKVKEDFDQLRKELTEYATTEEGASAIHAIDDSAVRKLRNFPGDITPARLVTIATKLQKRSK